MTSDDRNWYGKINQQQQNFIESRIKLVYFEIDYPYFLLFSWWLCYFWNRGLSTSLLIEQVTTQLQLCQADKLRRAKATKNLEFCPLLHIYAWHFFVIQNIPNLYLCDTLLSVKVLWLRIVKNLPKWMPEKKQC